LVGKKKTIMTHLSSLDDAAQCPICMTELQWESLCEHLMVAARLLRIVKMTHPEWSLQECEDYLKAISYTKDGMMASHGD
jgi:DNA-binding transcriptional regulator WhiA